MGMPVTVKGQVTIPKPIRDHLGLTPGESRVDITLDPDGRVVIRKAEAEAPPATDRFDRLVGCGTAMKGVPTDEIVRLLRGDLEDL